MDKTQLLVGTTAFSATLIYFASEGKLRGTLGSGLALAYLLFQWGVLWRKSRASKGLNQ